MSTLIFDLNHFGKESKNTLLNPGKYFSSLPLTGGYADPIIKVVAYGILAGLVYLLFWLLRIRSFGAGYVGEAVGFLAFIKIIVASVIGSGIGSLIILFISVVCGGNSELEANYRVTSSLMAILPIYGLLSITRELNFIVGLILSIFVYLYFLWLFYFAMSAALKCRKKSIRVAIYGFLLLICIVIFVNLRSNAKQGETIDKSDKPHKELKKI